MAIRYWLISTQGDSHERPVGNNDSSWQMQAISMDNRLRTTMISVFLIIAGGIFGFFLGGTFAANLVAGVNPLSDATVVAFSAIGSGIFGAGFGLYMCSRMKS